ncbi:MAG: ATP-binding protein [Dehalococcoidales bacterium]|nr:ATP-binding protein [Dehalococcoidales bacterium]
MKIGQRLILGFAIIVTLTSVLGIVGIVLIQDIGARTQAYNTVHIPMRAAITSLRIDISDVVRTTEEYDSNWITREGAVQELEELKAKVETHLGGLVPANGLLSPEELGHIRELVNQLYDASAGIPHSEPLAVRAPAMENFDGKVAEINGDLDAFLTRIDAASSASAESILNTISWSSLTSILVLVVVILAATVTAYAISRSISGPITTLRNAVIGMGKGDLAQRARVKSGDEVGELAASFNQMADEIQKSYQKLSLVNEQLQASNEELRATEEELRASNEELRATNAELKAAHERLVRSEKLAAIGKLAGGVGHELRNPLGAIKNAVYYIRGKVAGSELAKKEPRVMEFLDIVDEEIGSSTKIISDLLTFSRVARPAVSPARIEAVINTALSHTPIPENIALTKNLANGLSEIKIDTDQIRQVLINLITNAVQAMPQGGKLTIAARQKDSFMEVEVADTGGGIPQEVMGHLFEPLYTTKAKGIGLGLAVCRSIVERHDGHIEVQSQPGTGTSFTVSLPLKAQTQPEGNNGKK